VKEDAPHIAEEQHLAQAQLGVNHPNARVLGTFLQSAAPSEAPPPARPYVAYCGRYSEQKNVPLLVEWARRYCAERPGELDFVFVGQGDVKLPDHPWLRDLGRVDDGLKRGVLAGARALVQLSTQESLSLVVLEAWAQETPVIVHRDCAVLAGQIERSGGGVAVADYAGFAAALDDLLKNDAGRRGHGRNGRAYVATHYSSRESYVATLAAAVEQMRQPLAAQMRAAGRRRAAEFSRERWQERFAEFVERVLTQPARRHHEELLIESLRAECRAAVGARTLLAPVRVHNAGTHAAVADGPGRTVVRCAVRLGDGTRIAESAATLPGLLAPGQAFMVAAPVPVPGEAGAYRIALWTERAGRAGAAVEVPLVVAEDAARPVGACAGVFLDAVQEALPGAHALAQLPADYTDVTEGRLAPVKRFLKRKLLNNFKHAYVDVLSRQQSQVNGQVVQMIQQLAECCALLDHAVAGLHGRLDRLDQRVAEIAGQDQYVARPPEMS
jgi:hypothetical protein